MNGLGNLAVIAGVHRIPGACEVRDLAWYAVVPAIEGRQEPVTTEKDDL